MILMKDFLYRHRWLILVIVLAYAPFLGLRLIRTTGDEKVYIAQALEMKELGHWFVQVLGGQPDYYKGPLHYLLLLMGLKLFGLNLWSALYMNLVFCLAGALALAEIVYQSFPSRKDWSFWAGCFFAFNVGVYGHLFASQMEVELAGIVSVALYFLWRRRSYRDEVIFWILAGVAGWAKSPLHSVLLGCSALLFWLSEGVLIQRLRDWRSILCALIGISVCALGFAPAYLLDRENFVNFYFIRETLKDANGGAWWQSFVSILSYYLIPWMGIALLAYLEFFVSVVRGRFSFRSLPESEKRLWRLGVSSACFTVVFFCIHPYRGENYTLPVIAPIILLILLVASKSQGYFLKIRKALLGLSGFLLLLVPIALTVIMLRFDIPSELWPKWFLPLTWIIGGFCFALRMSDCFSSNEDGLGVKTTLSNVGLVTLIGMVLALFGEMEVYPLKNRIKQDQAQGKLNQIWYWNQNRLIWNEWGLMSLAVRHSIRPILEESDLLKAAQNGDLILARDTDRGREMAETIKKIFPELKPVVYQWNRWKTHAQDGEGKSLVPVAWAQKDLSLLWDHALIMRFER